MKFLSRKRIRAYSLLTAMFMAVQLIVGSFSPIFADAAKTAPKGTYADQGKIHFQLPRSQIHVTAAGSSAGWNDTVQLSDADNDGTYTADISALNAGEEYAYAIAVNGMQQSGPPLTASADDQGSLHLSYSPKFAVTGLFNASAKPDQYPLVLEEDTYKYTTETLPGGEYQYSFIASAEGTGGIRFPDPAQLPADGPDSMIAVAAAAPAEPAQEPSAKAAASGLEPDTLADQPGGSSKWVIAGSFQGWDNGSEKTRMKHLTGDFYQYSTVLDAGHHEFKIVKSGTWDGFSNGGNNFGFDLDAPAKVNFYVNEKLGQARINLPNVQGLPQYQPKLTAAEWPRLVGNIQKLFGEKEWAPGEAKQMFVDTRFDGSVYELQRSVPEGKYEMKVVLGNDSEGTRNYGNEDGENFKLNVLDPSDVIFSIDLSQAKPVLTTNYKPADAAYDGKINKSKLYFDSRQLTYKKPFGAIKEQMEDLTLRIAAEAGDVQAARVELTSPEGMASAYNMHVATSFGGLDYWETTIPKTAFQGIGVWNYKFILIDGLTKVEYGDDNNRGGVGTTADDGVLPYELTVYKQDFATPDWMKNAVVYQIFPDRFLDGNPANNRAKIVDGYRGGAMPGEKMTAKNGHKLQFFDGGVDNDPVPEDVAGTWSDVPENPDRVLPQNKPYFPDAKSDGIWTNEFYGGDIQGVGKKLDYLKSLGVTVIYFNPVAWAASNHKYDATDYKHLDPMFGEPVYNKPGDPASGLDYEKTRVASDRVFVEFAKQARAKGIRLIVDGVFNHVGDDSIYFDRYEKYPEIGAYEFWSKVYDKMNADSSLTQAKAEQQVIDSYTSQINPATGKHYAYPEDFDFTNWFKISNEKVDGHYKYEGWWGFDSLPVIDAPEPAAGDAEGLPGNHEWNVQGYRDQVIGHDLTGLSDDQASKRMQEANSQRWEWLGARGWRLDVAPDVSAGTWQKFRKAVKSTAGRLDANGETIDDPIILGEEWGVATKFLLGDQFDSVMNYRFRSAMQTFVLNGNANQFHEALESIREDYPKEAWEVMLNLVDSHDTIRSVTKYDRPSWEEEHLQIAPRPSDRALSMQALTAIFQMGYPGAPTIYYGDEVGLEGTKDPDSRRTFPWERVNETGGKYTGAGKYADLFATYQKAAEIRNDHEVFRTGDLKVAYDKGDVIAYARKTDTQAGLVIVNRGSSDANVSLDTAGFLPANIRLQDQLGSGAAVQFKDGKASLTIKAMSGMMMTSDPGLKVVPKVDGLRALGNNGSVTLTWNAVPGATVYHIYRAPIEGGTLEQAGTANEPTWTDSNVQNGTKYYYAVTAVIDEGESSLSDYVSATPFYPVKSVTITQPSTPVILGAGHTTSQIQAAIEIPGLSDNQAYAGKDMPGVTAKLAYYKEGASKDDAAEVKLRYLEDTPDGRKVYWAVFEPTEAGSYDYFAKVSTDNGQTYADSSTASVAVTADPENTVQLEPPVLAPINTESSRAQLDWTHSGAEVYKFEIYRKQDGRDFKKIAVVDASAKSYTDFTVTNDTTYTYRVAAIDKFYNRAASNEQIVTPKLVMVDVKLRLHLPGYTPVQDDIYIAGTINGWNQAGGKLNVPSGATTRDVVEYSFKMMAGKQVEYKYTRGTWDTEALTSHSRMADDPSDMSNYAYSSENTNMKLTIQNQGGNRMTIDDYVLRWADMPMIVMLPRTSYGEAIAYETTDDRFTLKANVPYGSSVTINGQPIPAGAMDAKGNVEVKDIPLSRGVNRFSVHTEPSAETLNLPWYEDKGRAAKATKTIEMTITRKGSQGPVRVTGVTLTPGRLNLTAGGAAGTLTAQVLPNDADDKAVAYASSDESVAKVNASGSVTPLKAGTATITVTTHEGGYQAKSTVVVTASNGGTSSGGQESSGGGTGGGSGSSPGNTGGGKPNPNHGSNGVNAKTAVFTAEQIKAAVNSQDGSRAVVGAGSADRVLLPVQTGSLLPGKALQVKRGADTFTIPAAVLEQLKASEGTPASGTQISLQLIAADGASLQQLLAQAGGKMHARLAKASEYYDLKLSLIDGNGKTVSELKTFNPALQLSVKAGAQANRNKIAFFRLEDDGAITWIGGTWDAEGMMTADISQPGKYAALEFTKSFSDLPANHWAADAVSYLSMRNIVTGTTADLFEPKRSVTRSEFAAFAARALGLTAKQPAKFADVPKDAWYAAPIAAAHEAGIVQGRSEAVFEPDSPITREEMAVMLIRAYEVKRQELFESAGADGIFKDADQISGWAQDAVQAAAKLGLLMGNENHRFVPKGQATRAESAQAIYRLLTEQ
ncbi:alpha-amylase family glycosyl hydrolase [Paenibacillus azoreducens]|uniref:alpha-amylase family glycosyl hydrolase n=1 Tax=Paenibacillus azoreducens TaxID=116718 RepID=UPI0039F59EE6